MTTLRLVDIAKTFTLYNQGGARLQVLARTSLSVDAGECVALVGPSGIGKSTLLRIAYGNYGADGGRILVETAHGSVDVARASPREILGLRRSVIGHVSQFLRVIPRVPAREVVAEAAMLAGRPRDAALADAEAMLARLGLPARLWSLSPTTFSGGEQQRVNIARVMVVDFPILLLDEPTASLDAENRAIVLDLIGAARSRGAAILGIFHDAEARARVATREIDFGRAAAAA
jgi:alpha-D-ribose 1-methylphosphonate 5-triphosphate synthase subunit PhnL